MSGVGAQQRARRIAAARPFHHIPKTEMADDFRVLAAGLLPYADNPGAQASALKCLDRAERLDQSPRCGWYPQRPKGWRP